MVNRTEVDLTVPAEAEIAAIDAVKTFLHVNLGPFQGVSLGLLQRGPEQLSFEAVPRAAKRIRNTEIQPSDSIITDYPSLLIRDDRVKTNDGTIYINYIPNTNLGGQRELPIRKKRKFKWKPYKTIEDAIRACYHIVDKNKPKGESTKKIIIMEKVADAIYNDLTAGRITDENRHSYSERVFKILEKVGLVIFKDETIKLTPVKETKKEAIRKFEKSLSKDRLGKFNPLASRSQAAAAKVLIVEELIIVGKIDRKYSEIATKLSLRREWERGFIEESLDEINSFLNMYGERYDGKFFYRIKPAREVIVSLRNFMNSRLHFDSIRTNPYRKAALLSYVYVFGFPKQTKEVWTKAVEETFLTDSPDLVKVLDYIHSKPRRLKRNRFKDIAERLSHVVPLLEGVLKQGERNLPESFFEQFEQAV